MLDAGADLLSCHGAGGQHILCTAQTHSHRWLAIRSLVTGQVSLLTRHDHLDTHRPLSGIVVQLQHLAMSKRASPLPALPDDRLPWEDLLTIRRSFAYNVPSRDGHLSYYCEAWGLDAPIFTGELHVLAKQNFLHLRLVLDGSTFADSIWLDCSAVGKPVPLESFIEGARDSSRYFVIRVGDAGLKPKRVVPIGVGFRERSQAFDLMAAIRDRINLVQRQGGAEDDMASLAIDDAKEVAAAEAKSDTDRRQAAQRHPRLAH